MVGLRNLLFHQLVASYFLPDQMGKEINHINEDKLDNSASEVQRVLGYKQTCITQCLLGHQRTAYGFIWKSSNV